MGLKLILRLKNFVFLGFLVFIAFFIQSTHYPQGIPLQNLPKNLKSQFQVGDFVFRKGLDSDSVFIAYLSHSYFSHIGMIVSTQPLTIIHATTNDKPQHKNQVILSSLEEFLSQSRTFGVKRLKVNPKIRAEIAKKAQSYLGQPFILKSDSTSLYCTTFLEESIKAYLDFEVPYMQINFPILGGKYLFPQSFWEHSLMQTILDVFPH